MISDTALKNQMIKQLKNLNPLCMYPIRGAGLSDKAHVKGPVHPYRCLKLLWLIRPRLRFRLGEATLVMT